MLYLNITIIQYTVLWEMQLCPFQHHPHGSITSWCGSVKEGITHCLYAEKQKSHLKLKEREIKIPLSIYYGHLKKEKKENIGSLLPLFFNLLSIHAHWKLVLNS